MTKRLLFSSMIGLIFQTCALAQSGYGFSSIYVDSGSGNITVEGYATVSDPYEDWSTASIYSWTNFGGSDNETDNCGQGCASSYVSGQVTQLGSLYTESTTYSGWIYYDDGEPYYWDPPASGGEYRVPSAPDIQLQSINAVSPHNVYWNYSISGVLPYTVNFTLGNILDIQNPNSSSLTFTVDQDAYPPSDSPDPNFKTAMITGFMYGLPFGGSWCPVTYTKNIVMSDYFVNGRTMGGDGIAPQFLYFTHSIIYRFSTVGYCIQPDPGSALTELVQAQGTIDTSNNDSSVDTTIAAIGETNEYGGQVDTLGAIYFPTYPQQGDQFQTREMWYGWSPGPGATVGPSEWFLPGNQGSICNVLLAIESPSGQSVPVGPPGGCISKTWP